MKLLLPFIAVLALCACITKPVDTAQTIDQKAFALYGEFVVFEELGAQIVVNPATPPGVKETIKLVDAKAKPAMDKVLVTEALVSQIRVQLAAGDSVQNKLDIAVADLNKWVVSATPIVASMVTTIKGVAK